MQTLYIFYAVLGALSASVLPAAQLTSHLNSQPSNGSTSPVIAFFPDRDANPEIYTMRLDGSGLMRLTNNPAEDSYPVFSPDGSKIVFESNRDGNFEIFVMGIDGSNQTQLTFTEGQVENSGASWTQY